MRLLVLLQAATVAGQIGFHDGFAKLVNEGRLDAYVPLCYRSVDTTAAWLELYQQAAAVFVEQDLDAVFLHFFHGPMPSPDPLVAAIRAAKPQTLVMASCGDPYGRWFHPLPHSMRRAAALADLSFFTGMGHIADAAVADGARNVLLLPHGCCQVRFSPIDTPRPGAPDADILFIGSRHRGRNPFHSLARAGRWRRRMVAALQARYGARFALYGHGWNGMPSWRGPLPFAEQVAAMRRARLVVGGYPATLARYYASDRPYIAMASGVPFLDFASPGMDRLFAVGEHWHPYHDRDGLLTTCDRLLEADQTALAEHAQRTRAWIASSQTQYHRCAEMVRIGNELMQYRRSGRRMPPPPATFMPSAVDPTRELPWTARAWVG